MGELKGWRPGKENKPKPQLVKPERPVIRERRRSAPTPTKTHTPQRRNPGRAARPLNLLDETSRSHKSNIDWEEVTGIGVSYNYSF